MTKRNPRPRKYASQAERQAAYRARNVMLEFRAEPKTADNISKIADTLGYPRSDVLLSMVKFALTNHDWARFGLTHKTIPTYKENPTMKPASPAQIAARKRFAEMARSGAFKKATKRKANPTKHETIFKIGDMVKTDRGELGQVTYKKSQPDGYADVYKLLDVKAHDPYKQTFLENGNFINGTRLKKATKRKANPRESTIKVGDYVRSYDFPGMHEDHYLEGEVIEVKPYSYIIHVMNRIVGGEKKTVTTALKQVEAPKGPHFITKVHGVQKVMKNPAKKTVSQKISQLVHEGYPQRQAVAVALSEQRAGKVKQNPRPAKPKKYIQVSIMEEGTHTKFMPMALYFTFAEAENYANYLAKQHKNWTIRVHDTRAM
jgi:transcription antitermination factor NusG